MAEDLRERLRYGTQLHNFVVEAVKRRRDFSQEKMRDRHAKWRKAEEAFVSYMPEKESDKLRRSARENKGEPQFTTIYMPYDYATLMSAHTYWTSVFLARNPVFQYQGTNGNSVSAEQAVETVVNYQVNVGRMTPPFYVWLLDVGKYGVGIVGDYWNDEKVIVNREVAVPDQFLDVDLGTTHKEMRRVVLPGYQGNKVYNVRPYDFLPDPRVTMGNVQEGEFCGRFTELGWNKIAKAGTAGKYFNVDVLRQVRYGGARSLERDQGSPQVPRPFLPGEQLYLEHMDMDFVELLEMYVELIPRDWGLDTTTFPEKWVFVVANNQVLLHAQPLGLIHNKFPFAVLEYEPDGYAMFKRGIMDIAAPMQNVLNWLVNTHFYNTRKALNDMFIVDPSRVVMKDVMDPNPGKVIRLKEEMYGSDVREAIMQLPVANYTQGHIQDTNMIVQMLQKVTGVNEQIMGMLSPGGRRSATEIRTSSTFGVNRLKTNAEFFSCTGFADLAQIILQQTQQFMDQSKMLRVAGDQWMTPGAETQLRVSPEDIQGFYDFVPVDGTLPIDRFALVSMWGNLMSQMANAPAVLATYDLGKIFAYIAQLGGLKNIQNFKIKMADTAMLQNQAAAGNVIPMGGPGGKSQGRSRGPSGGQGGVPVPRQVAGMGPSG
jgi:hypothetical protein